MKELNRKVFKTIFLILSLFILIDTALFRQTMKARNYIETTNIHLIYILRHMIFWNSMNRSEHYEIWIHNSSKKSIIILKVTIKHFYLF